TEEIIEEYVETITLSRENDWKHTWMYSDLPKEPYHGARCYYYVKEVEVDGFHVAYGNNDGIEEGEISITNTLQEGYVLPATGGHGVYGYRIMGVLVLTMAFIFAQRKKKEES
ncbi:MAG TPA: Cna B-type domain-containing protein, partial [Candidatus Merdenecus merdavium]|nr:Cna B-type domain-containing protein [Candidatus Merdenecus merdavium]